MVGCGVAPGCVTKGNPQGYCNDMALKIEGIFAVSHYDLHLSLYSLSHSLVLLLYRTRTYYEVVYPSVHDIPTSSKFLIAGGANNAEALTNHENDQASHWLPLLHPNTSPFAAERPMSVHNVTQTEWSTSFWCSLCQQHCLYGVKIILCHSRGQRGVESPVFIGQIM